MSTLAVKKGCKLMVLKHADGTFSAVDSGSIGGLDDPPLDLGDCDVPLARSERIKVHKHPVIEKNYYGTTIYVKPGKISIFAKVANGK